MLNGGTASWLRERAGKHALTEARRKKHAPHSATAGDTDSALVVKRHGVAVKATIKRSDKESRIDRRTDKSTSGELYGVGDVGGGDRQQGESDNLEEYKVSTKRDTTVRWKRGSRTTGGAKNDLDGVLCPITPGSRSLSFLLVPYLFLSCKCSSVECAQSLVSSCSSACNESIITTPT